MLKEIGGNTNFDSHYQVSFPGWRKNAGGLYYRGGWETNRYFVSFD
jgi:hypothetical protein